MSTQAQITPAVRTSGIKLALGLLGLGTAGLLGGHYWITDVRHQWHRVVQIQEAGGLFGGSRVAVVQKGDMLFALPIRGRMPWIDVGAYVCTSEARTGLRQGPRNRVVAPARCRETPKPLPPVSPGRVQ